MKPGDIKATREHLGDLLKEKSEVDWKIDVTNRKMVDVIHERRLAERQGEKPPVTYKTLRILPHARRGQKSGLVVQHPESIPLHICRGHFKDFREGPGLGKFHVHGVWWWHPQVRGSAERGAVKKDYEVVAEEKEQS